MDLPRAVLATRIRIVRSSGSAKVRFWRRTPAYGAEHIRIRIGGEYITSRREVELRICFFQQLADLHLEIAVVTLAEMDQGDAAVLVDQVVGRPGIVVVLVPDLVIAIDGNRELEAKAFDCIGNILRIFREGEFGGMHADDDEAVGSIQLIPSAKIRESSDAVDTRVFPEIDQHDFATKSLQVERARVEPFGGGEIGRSLYPRLDLVGAAYGEAREKYDCR